MDRDEQAAADAARELLAESSDIEAEETPSGPESPVAQEDEQETEETVEVFDVEAPEDLLQELDMPEFEEEPEEVEDEAEYLYDDPDALKRKLDAEKKKTAYLEGLRAQDNKRAWKAEALKFFPLAEYALDDIEAKSRRAYLREARKAHDAIKPTVSKVVENAKKMVEKAKADALTEAREQAAAAWGVPTTGPGVVPGDATQQVEKEKAIFEKRGLAGVMREMIEKDSI